MALCSSCNAPLRLNELKCDYCGTRNDLNLQAIDTTSDGEMSTRLCPVCQEPMRKLKIQTSSKTIEIDHCESCHGLWFDTGELEYLLTHTVKSVFEVNDRLMDTINRDRHKGPQERGYLRCPVCQSMMPFTNYGRKSGVIVDWCRDHGVWLDGGELAHLLEWSKAGGLISQRNVNFRDPSAIQTHYPTDTASAEATPGQHATDTQSANVDPFDPRRFAEQNRHRAGLFSFDTGREHDPGRSVVDAILRIFG